MPDTIRPKVPIAISASLNVDEVNVLARSTETVPNAPNGVDQRIGLLAIDLATYAPNVDLDDIRRRVEMEIPDVLQQHCPGHDPAFVADQILEKLELPGKKPDVLAPSILDPSRDRRRAERSP